MSHCLPVWFTNEYGVRAHGSMTVVNTGEAILAVTAKHVADRILECCDDKPGRQCQIGSALLPINSFIARHPDLDLATFQLSPSLVTLSGRRAAEVFVWPPVAPALREVVMFGGYPGIYRKANENERRFESDFSSFVAPVTDLDQTSFTVEIPLANSFSVSAKMMPPNVDLAGASGGGVFRLIETQVGNQIAGRLELTGIIYFGSPGWEVVRAHPISEIKSNGEFL